MLTKAKPKIIGPRYLVVFIILLLASKSLASSVTNFTKSVYYVPPTNFCMHDFSKDEYTDLFKYWGSGIQFESNNGDTILFMLEPACFINPQDRHQLCSPLMPRTPTDLRDDFNNYFRDTRVSLTNFTAAKIGKIAGNTCVTASSLNFTPDTVNQFVYLAWIQIESNIVVTVTINSSNKKSFDAATNSLRSLKFNKKEILKIIKSSAF